MNVSVVRRFHDTKVEQALGREDVTLAVSLLLEINWATNFQVSPELGLKLLLFLLNDSEDDSYQFDGAEADAITCAYYHVAIRQLISRAEDPSIEEVGWTSIARRLDEAVVYEPGRVTRLQAEGRIPPRPAAV